MNHQDTQNRELDISNFSGGFYQDQMGQAECKKCSPGTYVSVHRQPGSKASDCRACPYGECKQRHYPLINQLARTTSGTT